MLVLAPYLGGVGGAEEAARTLILTLPSLLPGHAVRAFSLIGGGPQAPPRELVLAGSQRLSLRSKARFSFEVLRFAARAKPALTICCHAGQAPLALLIRPVSGSPYAILCHGAEVWGHLKGVTRHSLRAADALWAVSDFTARRLREMNGIRQARVKRILHGTKSWQMGDDIRALQPWHGGKILTVARLEAYKGIDDLIRALARLAIDEPPSLTVVGDGSDRARLERIAKELQVSDRVTFLGRVSDQELSRCYRESDVFVLVSRLRVGSGAYGEGFGLVYLEAATHGLPVIAGSEGGSREALVPDHTGLLVPPGRVDALADALSRLLAEPSTARRMGKAGQEWVAREFSDQAYRSRLACLLSDFISGAGAP